MKPIESDLQAVATAKSLLLDPWDLNENHMAAALAEIFTHKVDYADLYFQYTRSESWSLEEGIVKTGSFSISQGVGVRALAGEKTAFAYSDKLSPAALMESATTVKAIARQGEGRMKVLGNGKNRAHDLYGQQDPIAAMPATEKVAL